MSTVLVIARSDLARDARVQRQLRWLMPHHRVIAAGLADPRIAGVESIDLGGCPPTGRWWPSQRRRAWNAALLAGRFSEACYWGHHRTNAALAALAEVRADVLIANDLEMLPLALRLARGAPVLFDAHEYAPREFEDRPWWRWLVQPYATALCRRYAPRAAAMTTVCGGIADAYAQLCGVRPIVVTNAPAYRSLPPRRHDGHGPIRLVHHGLAHPSRHLEQTIALMDHLGERFDLTFYLVGDEPYQQRLRQLARGRRICFEPPVAMTALPEMLHTYDVGVFLLPPVNFNYAQALPNKLFEFIQARLAVAIGPSPEMARVVRSADCGIVAADFRPETLAACLRRMTVADLDRYRQNAHQAAAELCAERNRDIFLGLVEQLLAGPRASRSVA